MSQILARILGAAILTLAPLGCQSRSFGLPSPPAPSFSIVEASPDEEVIKCPDLRQRIIKCGLPWKIKHRDSEIHFLLVPAGEYRPGSPPLPDLCRGVQMKSARDYRASRWTALRTQQWRGWLPQDPDGENIRVESFYLAEREVTIEEWKRIMGDRWRPWAGQENLGRDDETQVRLTQAACRDFCRRAGSGLRLPAEYEWEYAASFATHWYHGRSGSTDPVVYSSADSQEIRLDQDRSRNPLGLSGMIGNAAEICEDSYLHRHLVTAKSVKREDIVKREGIVKGEGLERGKATQESDRLAFEYGEFPVVKGGSFVDPKPLLGPWMRGQIGSEELWQYDPFEVGFRPAVSPPFSATPPG